jgi:hypothetical protein
MLATRVRAKQQFPVEHDGQTAIVPAGAEFAPTDPIVKANRSMFEPVTPQAKPAKRGPAKGTSRRRAKT